VDEKWIPNEVICKGSVIDVEKEDKEKDERAKKEKNGNGNGKKSEFNTNYYANTEKVGIFKLKVNIDAKEFLKKGKINLNFKKIEVSKPVFVLFEFDNYEPWLINQDEDGMFKTKFMIPPGRWRFFFTTQLA